MGQRKLLFDYYLNSPWNGIHRSKVFLVVNSVRWIINILVLMSSYSIWKIFRYSLMSSSIFWYLRRCSIKFHQIQKIIRNFKIGLLNINIGIMWKNNPIVNQCLVLVLSLGCLNSPDTQLTFTQVVFIAMSMLVDKFVCWLIWRFT